MQDYLKIVFQGLYYIFIAILLLIVLLFILFVLVGCIWFGLNPISFISSFFFDIEDVSTVPNNTSVVLNIGDKWEEDNLFTIQIESVQEISLEEFQLMNTTLNKEIPKNMRAFEVLINFENKSYLGTNTSAYGDVEGMYAIVHAYSEHSGPLLGSNYGEIGIFKENEAIITAIKEGKTFETFYAFLVPEEDEQIKIVIEVPRENATKEFYRREYIYNIP